MGRRVIAAKRKRVMLEPVRQDVYDTQVMRAGQSTMTFFQHPHPGGPLYSNVPSGHFAIGELTAERIVKAVPYLAVGFLVGLGMSWLRK